MTASPDKADRDAIDPWAILGALPEYVAALDAGGAVRYLNAAWRELFAEPGGLYVGDDYVAGFERAFAASDIDTMAMTSGLRAILAGERDRLEIEFPFEAGGQRRWFVATARAYTASGGSGALIQHREITRRRQIEAQLHESERELRALLAAMRDYIFVIDAQGRYRRIVPTGAPMLDQAEASLLGKTFHDVFPAPQADTFLAHVRRALQTRQTSSARYTLAAGGAEQWFAAAISPLGDDSVLWVARDITDLQ
jgi:PAS domain S-box-containing protein